MLFTWPRKYTNPSGFLCDKISIRVYWLFGEFWIFNDFQPGADTEWRGRMMEIYRIKYSSTSSYSRTLSNCPASINSLRSIINQLNWQIIQLPTIRHKAAGSHVIVDENRFVTRKMLHIFRNLLQWIFHRPDMRPERQLDWLELSPCPSIRPPLVDL